MAHHRSLFNGFKTHTLRSRCEPMQTLDSTIKKRPTPASWITGAQGVYNSLVKHNVQSAFLYSGGNVMALVDQFHRKEIKYTISANESLGCHAATGYAKASGKPGVYIATSGPGITNCITPMLDAQNDSVPLVVISGNVSKAARGTTAFQEAPATDITSHITKWSVYVDDVNEIPEVIDLAFHVAKSNKPGVVHVDIPACLFKKNITSTTKDISTDNLSTDTMNHDDLDIHPLFKRMTHALDTCQKPVLFLGAGCLEYAPELRSLLEVLPIPFTTTLHAMGIVDELHPQALSMCGMHGSYAANHALQLADCIIGIGTRFDDRTVGKINAYAPHTQKAFEEGTGGIFACNIEPSDIKTIQPHVSIRCDTRECIQYIYDHVRERGINYGVHWERWHKTMQIWKKNYPFTITPAKTSNAIKTQSVLKCLNAHFHEDIVITTGVGNHQMMAAQFLDWKSPRQIITSGSMGVMGTAIPYAIGAVSAANDLEKNKTLICIDGDGSFNMSLHDLRTIAEYDLPIKIFVMNDNSLSMVKAWEQLYYGDRYVATSLENNPDYVRLAKSFGIPSLLCREASTLESTMNLALETEGPCLVEFQVEGDVCLPLVGPGSALDDIIMTL